MTALACVALVWTTVAPASASQDPWEAVRQCESGGDYRIDTGNGYYGAYQFLPETWDWAVRGAGFPMWAGELPNRAPPDVQDAAAEWLRVNSGLHHWPVCGAHYGDGRRGDKGGATPVNVVGETAIRSVLFPIAGEVTFRNDWGEPRDGGARRHEGTDIGAPKHTPLLALVDGVVVMTALEAGNAGNMLILRDAEGWQYSYMHVNNDTPGTDDGLSPPEHVFGPGIEVGSVVTQGQVVAYVGDSGNSEGTGPHLHIEIRRPDGRKVNPYWSLQVAFDALEHPAEYLCREELDISIAAHDEGAADADASLDTDAPEPVGALADAGLRGTIDPLLLNRGFVDLALSPTLDGAWFVDAAGHVAAVGTAQHHGDMADAESGEFRAGLALGRDTGGLPRVAAIEPTPTGDGYWLAEADGTVHAFGDAGDHGSVDLGGSEAPVVDMRATASGEGYLLLTGDGVVRTAGDAVEHDPLDDAAAGPIEAIAIQPTPGGGGYWVLARDGRLARYGDAAFEGNGLGGPACTWTDLLTVVPAGGDAGLGWWVVADDSQAWAFGTARITPPPRIAGAVQAEAALPPGSPVRTGALANLGGE